MVRPTHLLTVVTHLRAVLTLVRERGAVVTDDVFSNLLSVTDVKQLLSDDLLCAFESI